MQTSSQTHVKIINADPSALGLFGLAIVTLVASSQKLGLTTGLSYAIPWAIFLGACAQLFACIQDSKRNNTFGTTAFGAFAFFWFAMAGNWMIKMGVFGTALANDVDGKQLGFAFAGYLVFVLFMTIGAMETHKVLFIIFCLIDLLFLGLTFDAFGVAPHIFHTLAAYAEMGIGIMSLYGTGALVLNTHFGKTFLPIGKPFGIFKDHN
ncbi:acetate uptake transporter [Paenibacillus sp. PsM32]|uniref:Acetate uptake transporter n=2 Tax=Paenibacillus TaxID=44249 RepID=A0ABW4V164_9BACL|nr:MULTISPECIES: acetate uptake transporter [Paenibacillus]MDN4618660.1 acetate uptake transporter [Paenibacillus sp. PsM32]MDQ1236316.1 succinate-acetate transporter protein [Paenibacillus sp. SORGH_AS_0306]MDR6108670.1 succinate-acetate transporter protein [Paenibacillus sp. SORGH_AS_0338]WCT55751.1 acetate uptake transporter [Paenibacillus kyungheensis]WDF51084.1 acetate uptake transporter [Paenibacillus sp. KACC 21273]